MYLPTEPLTIILIWSPLPVFNPTGRRPLSTLLVVLSHKVPHGRRSIGCRQGGRAVLDVFMISRYATHALIQH